MAHMKKFIYLMITCLAGFSVHSQTVIFDEDFDGTTIDLTSTSTQGTGSWSLNSNYSNSGSKSDSAVVGLNDSLILTTDSFNTSAYTFLSLKFSQICKIDFFDEGKVQYSTDNGSTWTTLKSADYNGSGSLTADAFSSTSYNIWDALNASAVPASTWWRDESFNLDAAAGFTDVRIRFLLIDTDNSGAFGNYGWLLDDIEVVGSTCELVEPTISLQGTVFQGTVFSKGPFDIQASVTDASGVKEVKLAYEKNSGIPDTLTMVLNTSNMLYEATIPSVNFGDTIDYTVFAIDSSNCENKGELSNNFISKTSPPPVCVGTSVTSYDYSETFSSFVAGNGRTTVGTLRNNWENATGTADTHDWWVYDQATRSRRFGTGPNADHSANDANYMFVEASGTFNNETAILNTPCYDFTNLLAPTFSFWYHMYGPAMGELHLDIYFAGAWILDVTPAIIGDKGDAWIKRDVNLSAYAGSVVKLRFRAITGINWGSDIAIDDIEIVEPIRDDIEVLSVVSPGVLGCPGSSTESLTIELTNNGLIDIDTIPLGYRINNGSVVIDTLFSNLIPGATINHTFQQTFDMSSSGVYDIDAFADLSGDGVASNDSILGYSISTTNRASVFPDTTDFDNFDAVSGNVVLDGWMNDETDYWFAETGSTGSSNTGPTADNTSGTGNYVYMEANGFPIGKTEATIISKCFDILNLNKPEATVYYNMYGADMGELHFDIYINGFLIKDISPSIAGDQGTAWKMKTIDLSLFKGDIRLAFRGTVGVGFRSDIAIDDLRVYDKQPVGVTGIQSSDDLSWSLYPNPVNQILSIEAGKYLGAELIIHDAIGKQILVQRISNETSKIDVSSLKNGIYFISINSENGIESKKFIKN